MTAQTRRRPRQLRYPRHGLETEARRVIVGSQTKRALRWGRRFLVALLVGYLLFAHGCHGNDEDHELCAWPFPSSSVSETSANAK